MQGSADEGAYSAALAITKGASPTLNAKAVTAQTGFVDGQDGVVVSVINPPTTGSHAGNSQAVDVDITQPQQVWFANLFLSSPPVAEVRAEALAGVSGNDCVLALDPTASGAVSTQGSSAVNLGGCNLQVNSSSSTALTVSGSSQLSTDAVSLTGNYTVGSTAQLNTNVIDGPAAPTISDPYAGVSIPSYSGCDYNHKVVNSTVTLQPGVYCNGLTINGTGVVTLNPGIYIIDQGSLSIMGGAVVNTNTATSPYGVTFILTSSSGSNYASVTINGGSTVNLTAPTTGPTAGLVFYQDRNDTKTANLNGGAGESFTGALYFPSATLNYSGDAGSSTCTQIVADQVNFTGNSTINSNCTGTGVTTITGYATMLTQ
jgi:hypothetical protein